MKIAIIGSGISGLSMAYFMNNSAEITIYEKNDYIGGHSRTINVTTPDGIIPVDTGFIVFNKKNYPHLTQLFDGLGVNYEKSDMSFGISVGNGQLEYSTKSISTIFAQKRNIFRPQYLLMLRDIFKFYKKSKSTLLHQEDLTVSELIDKIGLGNWFRKYFLLPMAGSIWSSDIRQIENFPAKFLVNFFNNHGLLSVNDQPQWYTVSGGSKQYIEKLTHNLSNVQYCGAASIINRKDNKIEIKDIYGKIENYEHVIFACHSDEAIQLLERPTARELSSVGMIKYKPNSIVVHSDSSFMPINRKCWASWVYNSQTMNNIDDGIALTYWMNNLQNLPTTQQIFVTVNPQTQIDQSSVHNSHVFRHPLFDVYSQEAQRRIQNIQGENNTWYVGAYNGYGFHEDGIASSVAVAKQLGGTIPW